MVSLVCASACFCQLYDKVNVCATECHSKAVRIFFCRLSSKVSEGVFRSGYPIACNFPFLRRLGLRSILCLCPESVLPGSIAWANEAGVNMEMCDLGENSPPFVSMPLSAMRKAVDFLSGEGNNLSTVSLSLGALSAACTSRARC